MLNSLTAPLSANLDLFQIADHCEMFAIELAECRDDVTRLVICGRLAYSLDVLNRAFDKPLPAHLIERLTVDVLPAEPQPPAPDSDLICSYSHALTQALLSCALTPEVTSKLAGLLFELVTALVEDLKVPRFIREKGGRVFNMVNDITIHNAHAR